MPSSTTSIDFICLFVRLLPILQPSVHHRHSICANKIKAKIIESDAKMSEIMCVETRETSRNSSWIMKKRERAKPFIHLSLMF